MGLSIDIQHNSIECRCAECRDYINVMLSVIMLNDMMLNVVMLIVVAPFLVLLESDFDVQETLRPVCS